MELTSVETLFGISHVVECSTGKKCELDIVILTDKDATGPKK